MKLKQSSKRIEIVRRFTVENGPILPSMRVDKKPFVVDTIRITYRQIDGEWVIDSPHSIDVGGTILKKDGTRSKESHSRVPASVDVWVNPTFSGDWAWVSDIVDRARPRGTVALPSLEGLNF